MAEYYYTSNKNEPSAATPRSADECHKYHAEQKDKGA